MPTNSSSPVSLPGSTNNPLSARPAEQLSYLRHIIEHKAHLLPAQGPITVFVHHNTLHAFEHLPFQQAVEQAARRYGCRPYLPEERYREMLHVGRIRPNELREVLHEDLENRAGEHVLGRTDRLQLRCRMLEYPLRGGSPAELHWLIAETDALRRFRADLPARVRQQLLEATRHWIVRDLCPHEHIAAPLRTTAAAKYARKSLAPRLQRLQQTPVENWSSSTWEELTLHALWQACRRGVRGAIGNRGVDLHSPAAAEPPGVASEAARIDRIELEGNELLIRFCAAFLDQGLAGWRLPFRDDGFYRAFLQLYRQTGGPPTTWIRILRRELQRLGDAGTGPLESIAESLQWLGLRQTQYEEALLQTLLELRGWAGMIWQLETRGDRVPFPAPPGTLVEYVAIRLIVQRSLRLAREGSGQGDTLSHGTGESLAPWQPVGSPRTTLDHGEQQAFLLFQVAQLMAWTPEMLFSLSRRNWHRVIGEVRAFSELERRRVFHLAFERGYIRQALDAISAHARRPRIRRDRPRFQVICCIDDREESFRRHLEEVAPDVETYGAAGFFGTAMYYRGADEAHFTPLCPIVMRPNHWVVEDIACNFADDHHRRLKARRMVGSVKRQFHFGSRTLLGGAMTSLLGSLATAPLVAEVLFPRLTARMRRLWGRMIEPPQVRQMVLERSGGDPAPQEGHFGFTTEEMAEIVLRFRQDVGLTEGGARLVIVFGHGSSSANNPHESAYNCGACAGSRGGPNARALAQMANDPRVRALLAQKGIHLPPDQYFLGAYHNTCDDHVDFYDLDRLPSTHRRDFQHATLDIEMARRRNAHERCRRFDSAPLDLTFDEALRHVEHRAENLAQTRPEYNHASNALTFVGRRGRTRGLFLDRRAFLVSYDPMSDDEDQTILRRIMQAVVPVCAGISLEYFFSSVDPSGYGCDNKLPHNITSLLGVMLGASSDLQPGLNTQMTEIHEPMRPLILIEAAPDAVIRVLARCPDIDRLVRNQWIQLALLDPHGSAIHTWKNGKLELYQPEVMTLPRRANSPDWYRGWRGHLGFAEIRSEEDHSTTERRSTARLPAHSEKNDNAPVSTIGIGPVDPVVPEESPGVA